MSRFENRLFALLTAVAAWFLLKSHGVREL